MMIKSFFKNIGRPNTIVIADNGTWLPIDPSFHKVVTVVDNTHQKITGDYHQCSKNHCSTIDYILKHKINTEWVLLVDNDILFKPDAKQFITTFDVSTYDAAGEVGWDDAPPCRLYPYFCLINVNKFNHDGINYFDNNRCIGPNSQQVGIRGPHTPCWYQDTGCSFYEDIQETWRLCNIQLSNYIVHMKCTGQNNKDYITFLKNNSSLY